MKSACLCDQCSALCCRYFVLEIDKPETRRQFDDVRWYLVHENTFVFIEKKKWYLGIYARCKNLQTDNRCGIYETRPQICRGYSTDNCDYHGGEYNWEILFSSAEQLEKYGAEKLAEARRKKRIAAKRSGVNGSVKRGAGGGNKARLRGRGRPSLRPALLLMSGGTNGGTNGNGHARRGMALPVVG